MTTIGECLDSSAVRGARAQVSRAIERIPHELRAVLGLFICTRVALAAIGVLSYALLEPSIGKQHAWHYSQYPWLSIWGIWDTGWYMDIATNGYAAHVSTRPETLHQANYGFFPLYPMLVHLLGLVVRDNFIAGVLLSSLCLINTGVFLHRMVAEEAGERTARRAVQFLFLLPTAYILSAALTESLFLTLCVMCIYYARRGRWSAAGPLGFLAALTRSPGFLLIVPLLWIYMAARGFRTKQVRADVLWLLLIPLGTLTFAVYCWSLTGDILAYAHIQETGWHHSFANPLAVLVEALRGPDIDTLLAALFPAAALLILIAWRAQISPEEFLFAVVFILAPLAAGAVDGSPRYLAAIFPLAVVFARLTESPEIEQALVTGLALLQGVLMVFWCNGFYFLS